MLLFKKPAKNTLFYNQFKLVAYTSINKQFQYFMKQHILTLNLLLFIGLLLASAPSLLAQNWQATNFQGMGFADGIVIHPSSSNIYVRTDVSGVFRWDGTSWKGLMDKQGDKTRKHWYQVESIAIDPTTSGSSQVIYAACGNNIVNINAAPAVMLKSTNNGETWTELNFPINVRMGGNAEWRHTGERLAVDPNNTNYLYFGSRENGLWRSTNAGSSWTQIASFPTTGDNGNAPHEGGLSFVVFDDSSTANNDNGHNVSRNVYVGVIGGGIVRSSDGGDTWCTINGGPDVNSYNPVRAVFAHDVLYVTYNADYISRTEVGSQGAVYQFDPNITCNSGTWTDKTPPPNECPAYESYSWTGLAVHPTNSNYIVAMPHHKSPGKIFYTVSINSTNPTWKIITPESASTYSSCSSQYRASSLSVPSWGMGDYENDFSGGIVFNPANTTQMWLTTGSGVWKIANFNASVISIESEGYMSGMEQSFVNQLIVPPAPNNNPLYVAAKDLFGFRLNSLTNVPSTKLSSGATLNGLNMTYSYQNPNTIIALGTNGTNPANGSDKALITSNGGVSWSNLNTFDSGCSKLAVGGNIAISAASTSKIVWAPLSSLTASTCGEVVDTHPHYSTNGGASWTQCANINFSDGNAALGNGEYAAKPLEADKVNGNKFYYYAARQNASMAQEFWRSTNGGATWTLRCSDCLPYITDPVVESNPYEEEDLWLHFQNREETADPRDLKLYHSPDGGLNWETLENIDTIYAFAFGAPLLPSPNPTMYVYGVAGEIEALFYSVDMGDLWTRLELDESIPTGLINTLAGDMDLPGRVYIGTAGRGVFYGDVNVPVKVKAKTVLTGAYSSGGMMSVTDEFRGRIRNEQPYNRTPWFYVGNEVISSPPNNMVDWILIEVRSAADNYQILEQKAALLLENGNIVDIAYLDNPSIDGVYFNNITPNMNYYISIKHRNHMALLSGSAISLPNASSHNFMSLSGIFGSSSQLVDLGSGYYGMTPGDFDSDGTITVNDFNEYVIQASIINQYVDGDLDLNDSVTVTDLNIYRPHTSKIGVPQIRY